MYRTHVVRGLLLGAIVSLAGSEAVRAAEPAIADLAAALDALAKVGPQAEGHAAAQRAWPVVAGVSAAELPTLMAALDRATPLGANWIRAAVDAVAERDVQAGRPLPVDALEAFVRDTSHASRGRWLGFEWLEQVDRPRAEALLAGFVDDPSLELRREAVARLVSAAAAAADPAAALDLYRRAFAASRDLDQVRELAAKLKELKQPVDVSAHLGFVRSWKLIGPFDNSGGVGFDAIYPPEQEINLAASYPGKGDRTLRWIDHQTSDEYGIVDLFAALEKENGSAAYALATLTSDRARPVQLRYATVNATKVWLNGVLLAEHRVYHSGSQLDQYVARGELVAGENRILIKVLQNEQTEPWAQKWEFQLRVCDEIGTAVLPVATEKKSLSGGGE